MLISAARQNRLEGTSGSCLVLCLSTGLGRSRRRLDRPDERHDAFDHAVRGAIQRFLVPN